MGRPKIRTDRQILLEKLWYKLARTTFAIVDYDIVLHKYKPKITDKEVKKLREAGHNAIDAALRRSR